MTQEQQIHQFIKYCLGTQMFPPAGGGPHAGVSSGSSLKSPSRNSFLSEGHISAPIILETANILFVLQKETSSFGKKCQEHFMSLWSDSLSTRKSTRPLPSPRPTTQPLPCHLTAWAVLSPRDPSHPVIRHHTLPPMTMRLARVSLNAEVQYSGPGKNINL